MVNRYAPWRYILLILIIAIGAIYATPNLYGEDPALQITHRVNLIDEGELSNIKSMLQSENIEYRSAELDGNNVLVRFESEDAQLKAATLMRDALFASDRRYGIALNLAPATPDWLTSLNALPMYLGLDLRGGVHFLMEVDMESAIEKALNRASGELRSFMREEKLRYKAVQSSKQSISVRFTSAEARDAARLVLEEEFRDYQFEDSSDDRNWFIQISFNPTALEEERRAAIEQNISTLKNRVNELGVAEPVIQRQGDERVVVQLPGVQDTVRAKEILGATATLEFRLVHGSYTDWRAAEASGNAPIGTRLYSESNGDPVLLKRSVIVTGDQIVGAASGIDQQSGTPDVTITMNAKGADRMARITRENIGKPMGVVFIEDKFEFREVDGVKQRIKTTESQVINVATIRDQLSKRFHITGLDSTREARDLALLLRAGALRVPLGHGRLRAGAGVHGGLLQGVRPGGKPRAKPEPGIDGCHSVDFSGDLNPARYRRYRFDRGYGGRRQRADFRTHPRGIAYRQHAAGGYFRRLRESLWHHCRRQYHDFYRRHRFIRFRHRPDPGFRGDADDRYRVVNVYRDLRHTCRHQPDLRT
jgi:preprotein translocase subunit SecD